MIIRSTGSCLCTKAAQKGSIIAVSPEVLYRICLFVLIYSHIAALLPTEPIEIYISSLRLLAVKQCIRCHLFMQHVNGICLHLVRAIALNNDRINTKTKSFPCVYLFEVIMITVWQKQCSIPPPLTASLRSWGDVYYRCSLFNLAWSGHMLNWYMFSEHSSPGKQKD